MSDRKFAKFPFLMVDHFLRRLAGMRTTPWVYRRPADGSIAGSEHLFNFRQISPPVASSPSHGLPISRNTGGHSIFLSPEGAVSVLQCLPRDLTISTKHDSYQVPGFIVKGISDVVRPSPQSTEFFLDLDDPRLILSKFACLFSGEAVQFTADERVFSKCVISILHISTFPP
jgi:hypothetical protein